MKCSDICYRLRWHTLALALLLAAGCASQLARDVPVEPTQPSCKSPALLICERDFRDRPPRCHCTRPADIPGLLGPGSTLPGG